MSDFSYESEIINYKKNIAWLNTKTLLFTIFVVLVATIPPLLFFIFFDLNYYFLTESVAMVVVFIAIVINGFFLKERISRKIKKLKKLEDGDFASLGIKYYQDLSGITNIDYRVSTHGVFPSVINYKNLQIMIIPVSFFSELIKNSDICKFIMMHEYAHIVHNDLDLWWRWENTNKYANVFFGFMFLIFSTTTLFASFIMGEVQIVGGIAMAISISYQTGSLQFKKIRRQSEYLADYYAAKTIGKEEAINALSIALDEPDIDISAECSAGDIFDEKYDSDISVNNGVHPNKHLRIAFLKMQDF